MIPTTYIVAAIVLSALLIVGLAVMLAPSGSNTGPSLRATSTPFEGPYSSRNETTTTSEEEAENTADTEDERPIAVLQTNVGTIRIELFTDLMPTTTENFLKLAREGFYDDTKFHRVVAGFIVQGGDPLSRSEDRSRYGQGGPGYTIPDEFVVDPALSNTRGTVAMANTGQPNSGGSQFFINVADNNGLDFDKQPTTSKHPVFGRVVEGMDIVDQIAAVETDEQNIPLEPIVIEAVEVRTAPRE